MEKSVYKKNWNIAVCVSVKKHIFAFLTKFFIRVKYFLLQLHRGVFCSSVSVWSLRQKLRKQRLVSSCLKCQERNLWVVGVYPDLLIATKTHGVTSFVFHWFRTFFFFFCDKLWSLVWMQVNDWVWVNKLSLCPLGKCMFRKGQKLLLSVHVYILHRRIL